MTDQTAGATVGSSKPSAKAKTKPKYNKRDTRTFYLLISPWIIGFLAFTLGPMAYSVYIAMTKWNMISPPKFVGLANFKYMFTTDPLFWKTLTITLIYTFTSVPLGLVVAIGLAMLMKQKIRGIGVFRTFYYIPSVISGVAISMLWSYLFNKDFGLVNSALEAVKIPPFGWFGSSSTALATFVLVSCYGVGTTAIIMLAGLKDIPDTYYESAQIDGAGRMGSFFHISLPLLTPTILFNLMMNLIAGFQIFTEALIITNGGPNNSTLFFNLYLYQNAFQYSNMGYASSLAWVLFIITFAVSIFIFRFSNRWVYYEGGEK